MKRKNLLLLLAGVLSMAINVSNALGRSQAEPKVTCGISTVSYRFIGEPGTEFRYGRDAYRVPSSGTIELIAEKRVAEYRVGDRNLPLNVWPQDEFGTRSVPLPKQIID